MQPLSKISTVRMSKKTTTLFRSSEDLGLAYHTTSINSFHSLHDVAAVDIAAGPLHMSTDCRKQRENKAIPLATKITKVSRRAQMALSSLSSRNRTFQSHWNAKSTQY